VPEGVGQSVPASGVSRRQPDSPAANGLRHDKREQQDSNDVAFEIGRLRASVEELSRITASQANEIRGLRFSLQQLQFGVSATARDFNELRNSRIWRSLLFAARLVLSAAAVVGKTQARARGVANRFWSILSRQRAEAGAIVITSDFPPADRQTVLHGQIEIHGWAAGSRGIERLTITIGNQPVSQVEYGIRRIDVGAHLPHFRDSQNSGFRAVCDTAQFPAGPGKLRIIATSRGGGNKTF
jgi:hypothetical protein